MTTSSFGMAATIRSIASRSARRNPRSDSPPGTFTGVGVEVPVRAARSARRTSAHGSPSPSPTLISLRTRRRPARGPGARRRKRSRRSRSRAAAPRCRTRRALRELAADRQPPREGLHLAPPERGQSPVAERPAGETVRVGEALAVADEHQSRARGVGSALAKARGRRVVGPRRRSRELPDEASSWRSVRHSMTCSQYGAYWLDDRVAAVPVGRRLGVQPVDGLRAVVQVGDDLGVGLVVVVARVAEDRASSSAA